MAIWMSILTGVCFLIHDVSLIQMVHGIGPEIEYHGALTGEYTIVVSNACELSKNM
jgi:hypothetical protein